MFNIGYNGQTVETTFSYERDDVGNNPAFYYSHDGQLLLTKGVTICKLNFEDGSTIVGKAFCGMKDTFNANKGRKVALMKALQSIPRSDRAQFWNEYFSVRHGKY
jgi:hypothetical protein